MDKSITIVVSSKKMKDEKKDLIDNKLQAPDGGRGVRFPRSLGRRGKLRRTSRVRKKGHG